MDNRRVTGPGAGAIKYDIITALAVAGLNSDPGRQISYARLISLITARYNWKTDSLSIGQKEMSDLWGVGERTAKREVKRWLESGVLICKRAGVRGRVASYGLNIPRVCDVTQHIWAQVGVDFEDRMQQLKPETANIIRLDDARVVNEMPQSGGAGGWAGVTEVLRDRFPTQFDAWIAPLIPREDGSTLVLEARSAFAAQYIKTHFGREICEAVRAEWRCPVEVVIRGRDIRKRL